MKVINLDDVKGEMILARSIYTPDGNPLLRRGVVLGVKQVKSLKRFSITHVIVFESEEEKELYEATKESMDNPFLYDIRKIYLGLRRTLYSLRSTVVQGLDWENADMLLKKLGRLPPDRKSRIELFINVGGKVVSALLREIFKGDRKLLSLGSFTYEEGGMLWEHWLNACVLSMFTALAMGYKVRSIWEIGVGALFHDLGKLFLDPESFFLNPFLSTDGVDFLTSMHTLIGYGILRSIRTLPLTVAHVAYQHHERFGGGGYPRNLERGRITNYARIVSVSNFFDALLSGRLGVIHTIESAALQVESLSGSVFDPRVVNYFLNGVVKKRML
ncbi:MAG: HD domain-containing protein [Synergistetes bacterium]|nr:HD domain-containing protein [Synergistota bacterium]